MMPGHLLTTSKCFCTLAFLVYQTIGPGFERTRRCGHVYAYAAIDLIFFVAWCVAAILLQTRTALYFGIGDKGEDKTDGNRTLAYSVYMVRSQYKFRQACVAFSATICILFAATTAPSVVTIVSPAVRRRNADKELESAHRLAAMDKCAWSTQPDFDASGTVGASIIDPSKVHPTMRDQHPGNPTRSTRSSVLSVTPPASSDPCTPSAMSPEAYILSPGGRVGFPQGFYAENFR